MSATYNTAEEAIKASAESGETGRCAATQQNLDDLRFEADDNAEGDEFEFWGTDEATGATWRVHAERT